MRDIKEFHEEKRRKFFSLDDLAEYGIVYECLISLYHMRFEDANKSYYFMFFGKNTNDGFMYVAECDKFRRSGITGFEAM